MQTFLPYPSFLESANVLDNKRLGKQRVEVLQILKILVGESPDSRWRNHPAVKMWEGYAAFLGIYGMVVCCTWRLRGFQDTCLKKIQDLLERHPDVWDEEYLVPPWYGNPKFHDSHRSNLLRKDSEYYGKFFTDVDDSLPYFWPTKEGYCNDEPAI